MIQYVFSTIFFLFFSSRGWGVNFKKELFLFLCYAYASLLSDCCYSSTASGTKARRQSRQLRQLRDLEKEARQGKARLAAGFSLSHCLKLC